MVTADHGPAVSGAHNTIVCARAGKDLVSSLVSGLLTVVRMSDLIQFVVDALLVDFHLIFYESESIICAYKLLSAFLLNSIHKQHIVQVSKNQSLSPKGITNKMQSNGSHLNLCYFKITTGI
jgi:hypothetical protein